MVLVQKLTQDGKIKITNIPIGSNLADLGTKVLDGSSIQKQVSEKCHFYIREGPSGTALRAEVQKPRGNILKFSIWTTKLTLIHNRSQTRLNSGEQIDARGDFLVANETVRWRTLTMRNGGGLVQSKNTRSSDRGGTETTAGPNGVTTHRESPSPTTQAQKRN